MVSKAWKELEKHVAEKLGGQRLSSANYCASQPDVVVNDISNAILGASVYDKKVCLIVECKYRTYQPWHGLVTDELQDSRDSGRVPLVVAKNMVFWDLTDTQKIMTFLFGRPPDKCSLIHIIQNFSITSTDRKIPLFLTQSLAQAECYVDWVWEDATLWIPIVCLGRKGSHKKIMVTYDKHLWGRQAEHGQRQAEKANHRSPESGGFK